MEPPPPAAPPDELTQLISRAEALRAALLPQQQQQPPPSPPPAHQLPPYHSPELVRPASQHWSSDEEGEEGVSALGGSVSEDTDMDAEAWAREVVLLNQVFFRPHDHSGVDSATPSPPQRGSPSRSSSSQRPRPTSASAASPARSPEAKQAVAEHEVAEAGREQGGAVLDVEPVTDQEGSGAQVSEGLDDATQQVCPPQSAGCVSARVAGQAGRCVNVRGAGQAGRCVSQCEGSWAGMLVCQCEGGVFELHSTSY